MKIILCGYHWSGCRALDYLIEMDYEIFVYTHENEYYTPSLKELCEHRNISYTTEKINVKNLPFKPDAICSVYYKYIISSEIISLTNGKIFNLHPSVLPKYKGCSSVTWALINQEAKYGFTWHYITSEVDGGNIILQKEIALFEYDLQVSAYYRIMFEGMKCFKKVLKLVLEDYKGEIQKKNNETYYKRAVPFKGEINEEWNPVKIQAFIRAMIFPPLPPAVFKNVEILSYDDYSKQYME